MLCTMQVIITAAWQTTIHSQQRSTLYSEPTIALLPKLYSVLHYCTQSCVMLISTVLYSILHCSVVSTISSTTVYSSLYSILYCNLQSLYCCGPTMQRRVPTSEGTVTHNPLITYPHLSQATLCTARCKSSTELMVLNSPQYDCAHLPSMQLYPSALNTTQTTRRQ